MFLGSIENSESWDQYDMNIRARSNTIRDLTSFFQKNVYLTNKSFFSHSSISLVNAVEPNDNAENQNHEEKQPTGKWKASIKGMQDSNGTASTEVSFKAEKKVTDDISYSIDVSTTIKNDKTQGPAFETKGTFQIEGSF